MFGIGEALAGGIDAKIKDAERKVKLGFFIIAGMLAVILWRVWK